MIKGIDGKLCRKLNYQKLWSKTPTSEYITDIAESIVSCEWKNGKNNYRATCCSQNRWLVAYDKKEVEEETLDAWSGCADDNDGLEKKDDEESANFVKIFGFIPKFACAYEVLYNNQTSFF